MWTSVSRVRTYLLSNVGTAPSKVEKITSGCHRVWLMTFRNNVAQLWVMNRWTAISHYFCKDHDKSNVQASLASHWNKATCFIFKLAKSINNEASTEAPNSTTFSMWRCRKGGSVSQRCVHKTARHYKFLMRHMNKPFKWTSGNYDCVCDFA